MHFNLVALEQYVQNAVLWAVQKTAVYQISCNGNEAHSYVPVDRHETIRGERREIVFVYYAQPFAVRVIPHFILDTSLTFY